MRPTSLESNFITVTDDSVGRLKSLFVKKGDAELRHKLKSSPFNVAYDVVRLRAAELIAEGDADRAITMGRHINELIQRSHATLDTTVLHAAVMQVLTAVFIATESYEAALSTAADTLTLLSQEPRRKDEPFLQVLGALLYDLSFLHIVRKEYKAAERTLEKSMRIFERLAKMNPDRYGSAHIMALNASTSVYRSRVKQVNLLAHFQVATSTYLEMVNSGIHDAMDRLIESLANEGEMLMQLGKYRDAVQYYSRALKYLSKLSPEFSERHLKLSIKLSEALLHTRSTRQKGVHLLNTLLQKAVRMKSGKYVKEIETLLDEKTTGKFDILALWHKAFPK